MKRKFSLLVVGLVAAAASMAVLAPPASAHDQAISVNVECDNGSYDVTWTVKNWSGGGTATILESSRSVVPVGTTFADGQTKTFTESVSAPATLQLSLKSKWSNDGYSTVNSKTLSSTAFPSNCTPPDQPVTPAAPSVSDPTCAADGALVVPADPGKVTYSQSPAGSGPGTYTVTATAKPGYTIEGQSSWTLTVHPKKTGEDCLTPVTPAAPSVTDPTCAADGALVVPADTDKVDYNQEPAGSGPGTYTVTATAKDGYEIDGDSSWTLTVEPKKSGEECLIPVTAATPTAVAPSCDLNGWLALPGSTEAFTYTQAPMGTGPGVYTIDAVALPGYKLVGTASWVVTVLPKLTDGCDVPVTPVAPEVTTISECGQVGSVEFATTEGIDYALTEGDGKSGPYTVTATAQDGYVIADGATSVFTGDLGTVTECPDPVVDPPTTVDPDTETPTGQAGGPPGTTVLPNTGAGDQVPLAIAGLLVIALGLVLVRRSART